MLREAVFQTKSCYSPKTKQFWPHQIFGLAALLSLSVSTLTNGIHLFMIDIDAQDRGVECLPRGAKNKVMGNRVGWFDFQRKK